MEPTPQIRKYFGQSSIIVTFRIMMKYLKNKKWRKAKIVYW